MLRNFPLPLQLEFLSHHLEPWSPDTNLSLSPHLSIYLYYRYMYTSTYIYISFSTRINFSICLIISIRVFLRILPKSHSDIYICTILSTYSHSFSILFCINLGPPVMVSGSNTGHIAVWNLEERKLASQIRTAHGQGVQGSKLSQDQSAR